MITDLKSLEYEKNRLKAVRSYGILNGHKDEFLDNITSIASKLCDTPIALVTLIDEDYQFIKSSYGTNLKVTTRDVSFCHHTIKQNNLFEVEDATFDPVFANNPLVTGKAQIRFYAGFPLTDDVGYSLGALCVIGNKPKKLTAIQKESLEILSKSVIHYIMLKNRTAKLELSNNELLRFFALSPDFLFLVNTNGRFIKMSQSFIQAMGYTEEELLASDFINFIHYDDRETTLEAYKNLLVHKLKINFFSNKYRKKDGTYMHLTWKAVLDSESEIVFAVARDMTDLEKINLELDDIKNREKELIQTQNIQLKNLASRVSHELLNPVNMVIGFADLLPTIIKQFSSETDLNSKTQLAKDMTLDLEKIQKHCQFILDVLLKMHSEINWISTPSIMSSITEPSK